MCCRVEHASDLVLAEKLLELCIGLGLLCVQVGPTHGAKQLDHQGPGLLLGHTLVLGEVVCPGPTVVRDLWPIPALTRKNQACTQCDPFDCTSVHCKRSLRNFQRQLQSLTPRSCAEQETKGKKGKARKEREGR